LKDLLINAFISVGLTTTVLLAAGRFLGERLFGHWLDGRLQSQKEAHEVRLAELKSEQDRQIEKLRGDIGHLQDRGRRANEGEFSALSAIYGKLEDLFEATNRCVGLCLPVPNWDRMDDAALARFLEANEFTPGEKAALQSAKDKQAAFSRVMAYRSIAQAQAAYDGFRTVLDRQSIFIPKSLADRLNAAGDLCPGAIAVRLAETEGRRPHNMMDDLVFREKRNGVLNEIRDAVRERLQYEDRKMGGEAKPEGRNANET
jgi:hypothetical protein